MVQQRKNASAKDTSSSNGTTENKAVAPPQGYAPIVEKDSKEITYGSIRASIPKHCFERSYLKSFYHLFVDLACMGLAYAAIWWVDENVASPYITLPAWGLFYAYAGITATGLWVIAHECGHGGFSDSETVNDIVGLIVHTMLYVPYFSWKYSHAKHHQFTNHMTMDEVHIPQRKSEVVKDTASAYKMHTQSDLVVLMMATLQLTVGWPLYLMLNTSGPTKDELVCHYDPSAPIFRKKDYWRIVISDVALIAWTYVLYQVGVEYGWWNLVRFYLPVLMIVNVHLVSITFLQHTEPDVAHFDDEEWTPIRGALSTIDRSMGDWYDRKLHHIVDSHVVHHIYSFMPFYGAKEATPHVAKFLGKYYQQNDTPFWTAYWNNLKTCVMVDGEGILQWLYQESKELK